MIRQSSGAIVASPAAGGEEKTLIAALTVQGSGSDRTVAGLAPGVHRSGAIRTQRWRTAARELRKLQAETEVPMRRLRDIVKVSVVIVGVIIATIVMFQTIGLLS